MNSSSAAFERLHPELQRWIHRKQWPCLRPIQEEAVGPVLEAQSDVILSAATASGKTEAAFLPVLTSLANRPVQGSLGAICISPLKALINDQFDRLEELGTAVQVKVSRWHGDVPSSHKRKLVANPSGVLIITPESLEALFVRRGSQIRGLCEGLRYLIIDELHAFIGSERGRQLQSLLHRMELVLGRRVPRLALSATLGDLSLAAKFLRIGGEQSVLCIEDHETGQEVKLQVRGYRQRGVLGVSSSLDGKGRPKVLTEGEGRENSPGDTVEIARDLFDRLRGGHHLIFANTRSEVERFADLLRRLCDELGVPNEFWPHHGSLSKDLREEAESAINNRSRPTTLVATSTLELGIDIGAIESVAQIGTPPSVSALRQRLGRSGRQGEAAVLRIVIQEPEVTPQTSYQEALHPRLVQSVAMVELLIQGWVEPPTHEALHLSTLVQQVLSLLAQTGGANAREIWRGLCGAGPFSTVSQSLFQDFLRCLGRKDLITQDHTGELTLGFKGENLVDHYSFYSAFSSPEEYRLVSRGRTLGQLPIGFPLFPGLLLIFGGRRWRVVEVEETQKVVNLDPAVGGKTPQFAGSGGPLVHCKVREEMLSVFRGERTPAYLDSAARDLLAEARSWFERLALDRNGVLADGKSILVFPWAGDRVMGTLALLLNGVGLVVTQSGFVLEVQATDAEEVSNRLKKLAESPLPSAPVLAKQASNRTTEKFHPYLGDELLIEDYAAAYLDVEGAGRALRRLASL